MSRWRTSAVALLLTLLLAPVSTGCGKTVGETVDDATITTRVKTALLNELDAAGIRIDVDTFRGVVTLSGPVESGEQRDKAVAVVRRVDGVVDVKSTLQIRP